MNMRHFLEFVCLVTGVYVSSQYVADWRAINTSYICPKVGVCGLEPVPGDEMCCRGCSCDEDCKRNKNCCYKGGSNIKCIRTTVHPFTMSYFMETSEPNIVSDGKPSSKPCLDSRLPDWLQMLPVYSNSTRRIFINRVCAESHGVFDFDEVSHVSLICGVGDEPEDAGARINDAVLSVHSNELPPGCFVNIHMPDIEYIRMNECIGGIVDVCSPDYIESDMDEHISRACTSDFHSPVGAISDENTKRFFKNPFCVACNNYTLTTMTECAANSFFFDEVDIPDNKFTLLVDPRKLKPDEASLTPQKVQKQVCLKKNEKINLETCRPVLCPWGQVRVSSGTCVWLSRSLFIDRFLVTLKLTPNTVLRETDINSSTSEQLLINNPWPKTWVIHSMDFTFDKNNFISQFFVVMHMKSSETDIERIIETAKMYSVQDWTIKFRDENITFTSNFSKTKLDHDRVTHKYLITEDMPMNEASLSISEINFCYQVQLLAHEFTHYHLINSIVSVLTDRQYFNGEFIFVSDRHGTPLPRICLDNSGFVEAPHAAGSRVASENYLVVVQIILWIMFSTLY